MILVFGKAGQLATAFQSSLAEKFPEQEVHFASSAEVDLLKPGQAKAAIEKLKPALVINCSAYTAVDKAETESDKCYRLNAEAVEEMAFACSSVGARLLHFSTDYVYPGSGNWPYSENDPKGPLNVYGQSKLAGEIRLQNSGAFFHTIRVSWVYSATGTNFVNTMLRLGKDRAELKVVADQIGSPMSAVAIADLMTKTSIPCLLQKDCQDRATYNLSSAPFGSWDEFAREIFKQAKAQGLPLAIERVLPIPSSDYPTPAKRPLNSRLSDAKFRERFGQGLPDWRESLQEVIRKVKA